MVGDFFQTLILIMIAILLLAGEKDVASVARNIGKAIEELKRRQSEIKNELMRELNEVDEVNRSVVREMTYDDSYKYVRPSSQASSERIKELEEQINKLKLEIERLKKGDGKNGTT